MSNMNAYIEAAMIQCPRCGASTGSKCWAWRCKNGYKGCNFRVCAYKAELPEPHLERAVAARKTAPAGGVSPADVARIKAEALHQAADGLTGWAAADWLRKCADAVTEGVGETFAERMERQSLEALEQKYPGSTEGAGS